MTGAALLAPLVIAKFSNNWVMVSTRRSPLFGPWLFARANGDTAFVSTTIYTLENEHRMGVSTFNQSSLVRALRDLGSCWAARVCRLQTGVSHFGSEELAT